MANIDVEMGQFQKVTTLENKDYIVVSLDNGTQGQIKVSDLASVVAAVPEFINLALKQATHHWGGINANDVSSLYLAIVNSASSTNWPSSWHGLFLNIPFDVGANMQIVYDTTRALYMRQQWSGEWSSWTKLH